MQVRNPGPLDVSQISEIEKVVRANPWTLEQISSEIELSNAYSAVLVDESEICAYLLTRSGSDEIEVMNIGVSPKHQRKGYASILLKGVQTSMPSGTQMLLEVSHLNIPALQLYQKLGFLEISRRKQYYRDGRDAIIMKWEKL